MNLLKNNDIFRELIEVTATEKGLLELIVEKDFIVSVLLERLSNIDKVKIIFKGGTSLFKCYSVINRFSEDIDIAIQMEPQKVTNAVKKNLKKEILNAVEELGFEHINPGEVKTRRDFNRYEIRYPKNYVDSEAVNLI